MIDSGSFGSDPGRGNVVVGSGDAFDVGLLGRGLAMVNSMLALLLSQETISTTSETLAARSHHLRLRAVPSFLARVSSIAAARARSASGWALIPAAKSAAYARCECRGEVSDPVAGSSRPSL